MGKEKLAQYLESKGLKNKADENLNKTEATKADFKDKEKKKALTQAERIDRIEQILGIN